MLSTGDSGVGALEFSFGKLVILGVKMSRIFFGEEGWVIFPDYHPGFTFPKGGKIFVLI